MQIKCRMNTNEEHADGCVSFFIGKKQRFVILYLLNLNFPFEVVYIGPLEHHSP